jgi:hypothetical protein
MGTLLHRWGYPTYFATGKNLLWSEHNIRGQRFEVHNPVSEIVNLNQFRKKRRKTKKETQAAENRVKFGRTKAQRQIADKSAESLRRNLNGKQLEDYQKD